MTVPIAFYLASRAADTIRSRFWLVCGFIIAAGAATTVSRTIVLMGVVMIAVGLYLRGQPAARATGPCSSRCSSSSTSPHPARSGTSTARSSRRAASGSSSTRASAQVGSGRLSDIAPGLRSLRKAPVFGHGLGTGRVRGNDPRRTRPA